MKYQLKTNIGVTYDKIRSFKEWPINGFLEFTFENDHILIIRIEDVKSIKSY